MTQRDSATAGSAASSANGPPAASTPPRLVDPGALGRRRDRAMGLGFRGGADFLWAQAGEMIAERLEDTARAFPDVLIHGTGAGVVAERLPAKAGQGSLTQVDVSPRMAEAAARAHPEATTQAMAGDVLPVAEGAFDLAVSCLMLHWADDPVGLLVQLRRALRPDGLMIAALFGGQTLHELRACLATAESEISGGLSPRVAPMGEIRDLGALLQRAGYAMPVADSQDAVASYPSALHLMRELRAMGETNILAMRHRAPLGRRVLLRAAEIYAERYGEPGDRVRATFEIVFLTGWSPGEGQPQPLRPGSAANRLADALGTVEIPAGDKAAPGGASGAAPGNGSRGNPDDGLGDGPGDGSSR